jgi:6-pyruvoyltetrahydropterin/6-carboxytetrahydropterin synthase
MILDFGVLKVLWKDIYDKIDHQNLNDVNIPNLYIPTAENLAGWIFDRVNEALPPDVNMNYVTIWETDDSSATVANA